MKTAGVEVRVICILQINISSLCGLYFTFFCQASSHVISQELSEMQAGKVLPDFRSDNFHIKRL